MRVTLLTLSLLAFLCTFSTQTFAVDFTVNTTSDLPDTNTADGVCQTFASDCSLRAAIQQATNLVSNDRVLFSLPANSTITLTSGTELLIINRGTLEIVGTGANNLTIDGGAGENRIFTTDGATVTISGLTLTGGNGRGSIFTNSGGAIFAQKGTLILDRVHITANSAPSTGGVSYLEGTNHQILNSTLSANSANKCGGFQNAGGNLAVINSTISGNSVRDDGGGFCSSVSNTTLRSVTITGNSAANGGGIDYSGSTLNLRNTIVAGNTAGSSPDIHFGFGTLISEGFNLIGDSPGDSTNTERPITYQETDILDTPPLLGALQNNGGTTPTHSLLLHSPAINKGNNTDAPTTDQRGFARIVGGVIDIGAYESDSPPTTPKPTPTPSGIFTNSETITIKDVSVATPYPSNVTVAGLTGTVTDINVRLNGLSHTFLGDVSMLLVSPDTSRRFVLLSDCGSLAPVNVTVTFDDQASRLVPCDATALPTASYRPTSRVDIHSTNGTGNDPTDSFPAPAPQPASSYSQPPPTGTSTLNTTFGGVNPNGIWSLYIIDKFQRDEGTIANGYSLIITTAISPTAATVTVGGRVTTANGRGIPYVRLAMTGSNGETQIVLSNALGYYNFNDVPAGETYIFNASHKRYSFTQSTQVHSIVEETKNVNFVGQTTNLRR